MVVIHSLAELQFVDRNTAIDIDPLVSLACYEPQTFVEDETILNRLVELIVMGDRQGHKVKLDVLKILATLAQDASMSTKDQLQLLLGGVSEWFDAYVKTLEANEDGIPLEISLHSSMVLFLARLFDYELKTEDVLELIGFSRCGALMVVISLFGDPLTRQPSGSHGMELPLLLQLCRLLRGFTVPNSYFSHLNKVATSSEFGRDGECKEADPLMSRNHIQQFSVVINSLLSLTMEHDLVDRIATGVCVALFTDEEEKGRVRLLDSEEHTAVIAVNAFLQNLYLFGEGAAVIRYQKHLLEHTSLIPTLILPYLESCALEARLLDSEATSQTTPQRTSPDKAALNKGVPSALSQGASSSLRTLIMATFRASKKITENILVNLNPTNSLLRSAPMLLSKYPELLALLCLLNVNINSMDTNKIQVESDPHDVEEDTSLLVGYRAHSLVKDIAFAYSNLSQPGRQVVFSYLVTDKHGLPISRDLPSFRALLTVIRLEDKTRQSEVRPKANRGAKATESDDDDDDDDIGRSEAKLAVQDRLRKYKTSQRHRASPVDSDSDEGVRPKGAVSTKASASSNRAEEKSFRLLGDLPALSSPPRFTLPSPDHKIQTPPTSSSLSRSSNSNHTGDATPTSLCCAINGHVMKDPARAPSGHVFEYSTILLWLKTRGSVCPCTGEPLREQDLVLDNKLRIEIMRWHIQKRSATNVDPEENMYDF